jgi:hypothetical protein
MTGNVMTGLAPRVAAWLHTAIVVGLAFPTRFTRRDPMKIHPKITARRIENAVRRQMFDLDSPGFCIECGNEQEGCEPDARKYECERCGEKEVYSAAALLLTLGD